MGKIKHTRKTFHASAPKVQDASMEVSNIGKGITESQEQSTLEFIPKFSGVNIFKNVEIPASILKQQLVDDFDKRSIVSSMSVGKQMTKKEKRTLRHQKLREKLEARKVAQEKIKAAEKRKQTPVVGDMQPLIDALPILDDLFNKVKSIPPKERTAGKRKLKQKHTTMLNDIEMFQQMLKNPKYVADPFGTVRPI